MRVKYEGELLVGKHIKLRFEDGSCQVLVEGVDITSDCKSLDIHVRGGPRAELRLTLLPKIQGELLARMVQ